MPSEPNPPDRDSPTPRAAAAPTTAPNAPAELPWLCSGNGPRTGRIAQALRDELEGRRPASTEARLQPQILLEDGSVAGAEALVRWRFEGEPVEPERLVGIAEDAGLSASLGRRMLLLAAEAASGLRAGGTPLPRVSVKASPSQSEDADFPGWAAETLLRLGLRPADVEIEIGNSPGPRSGERLAEWARSLDDAGFGLAIEGFGSGSSSADRALGLPASTVKVARSIVDPLPENRTAAGVAVFLSGFIRDLGLRASAGRVETRGQAAFLRKSGFAVAQGYRWGMPMTAEMFGRWSRGKRFALPPAGPIA